MQSVILLKGFIQQIKVFDDRSRANLFWVEFRRGEILYILP